MTDFPEAQLDEERLEKPVPAEGESGGRRTLQYARDYLFLFLFSGAIVLLDQVTKYLVRVNLPFGGAWAPWDWLLPYARVVHWQNTGAAFGMFQNFGLVFTLLAVIVSAAIIYYYPQVPAEDWTLRLAMALQLGGALGNLVSRLTVGEVTDFVSIWRFPVFNVADLSITLGVIILILGMLRKERKDEDPGDGLPEDREGELPALASVETALESGDRSSRPGVSSEE